jgi:hypothetical protein
VVIHRCDAPAPERPYICDIGPPKLVSMRSFKQLVRDDAAIWATVRRIGVPDRVEVQRIYVNEPWLGWEIRAYYRDYNRMFAYGRAFILGSPAVSLLRYEGPIPPELMATTFSAPLDPNLAAERAAQQAERAAADGEALADRATRFADRAEAATDKLDVDFKRSLIRRWCVSTSPASARPICRSSPATWDSEGSSGTSSLAT